MLEPLNWAEVNCQHAELLPERTVLSLMSLQGPQGASGGKAADGPHQQSPRDPHPFRPPDQYQFQ